MPHMILWEHYISKRRQWIIMALFVVMVSMLVVGLVFHQALAQAKNRLLSQMVDPQLQEQYADYKTKEEIYTVLRSSGIELGDAMEIAQTVIEQSKKTNIPVMMFLAMMKKESNFTVDAVSSQNAMGVMQIHPVTWDAYVKKLNLQVTRQKAFDPSLNIIVSAAILSDLREHYQKAGYEEPVLWDYVLSAYYAGMGSVKDGLNDNHRQYVKRVRKYVRELSKTVES